MALFKTTDSALGSVLRLKFWVRICKHVYCQNNRGAKLAWADSKAKSSRFKKGLWWCGINVISVNVTLADELEQKVKI